MAMWETREIWRGQTIGGHEVKLWLHKGIGVFMSADVWRVQWSVQGGTRSGKTFYGEPAMRAGLDEIQAANGLEWTQAEVPHP